MFAGCGFHPNESADASTRGSDASIDVAMVGSAACFDADGVTLHVCLASPPSGSNNPSSTTIDTSQVGGACEPLAPASDPACVMSGDTITIADAVTLSASGSQPLVLIANQISIAGTIDVASYTSGTHAGKLGPLANYDMCLAGTAPTGRGGGAGGSFGTQGAGGGSNAIGDTGGAVGGTLALALHGGCPGQVGGEQGGTAGAGGGVVVLIAPTIEIAGTGTIDASGAGGGGAATLNTRGGGGGGSGGLVVLSSTAITISGGQVFANGGGGGGGTQTTTPGGNGGDPVGADALAPGGAGGGDAGAGGVGFYSSAATPVPATAGSPGTNGSDGGGGGGGGAGIIHVPSGAVILGAPLFSPAP